MSSGGFRVVVDFSEFFSDDRRKSYVYIDNALKKTVLDLQCRIRKLFNIKNDIYLLADGCFLHPQETVLVLHEEDVVKVIRSGSSGQINDREEEEQEEEKNNLEDCTFKRKRKRVKEAEKAEDCNPRPRKSKIKKYERTEAVKEICGNGNLTDNSVKFSTQASEGGNSQWLTNQIDLQMDYESEITANDSIQGYKKKIKRKRTKKNLQKEPSDSENGRGERACEEPDVNVSGFSQTSPVASSSQYVDSGVAASGEGDVESQIINKESVDAVQFDSAGIKKKRRRRHRKKKENAATVSEYPSMKVDVPPVRGMLGSGKHIKFVDDDYDDSDDAVGKEKTEEEKDDGIPYHKKSSTIKNSLDVGPTQKDASQQSDISAEIISRIKAFIKTRNECNVEIPMHTPSQQKLPKRANNFESPHTQWDVQSAASAGSSQLFSGIFNSKNISTPLIFECKKPAAESKDSALAQNSPEAAIECDKLSYSEFPLLQGSPRENDVLVFKVWKLGEDYSPGISDYIVGKVLIFSEPEKYIKFKILHGHAELKEPDGKFSINRRPKGDEEDEELIELEEEPLIDELETELGKIFEVRLLFP